MSGPQTADEIAVALANATTRAEIVELRRQVLLHRDGANAELADIDERLAGA